MVERVLFGPGGATEAKQDTTLTALADLLTELGQKLEPGQDVALSAATLAALETITATISNLPADYPDAAVLAKVEAVRALLAAALTVEVSNFPAEIEVTNNSGNPLGVADDYTTEAHAADQAGADAVLTFAMTAGAMVMVDVDPVDPTDTDNYRTRATCDGTVPTGTTGFVCRPGTSYLPVPTAGTVKVWAPTGVVVAVQVVTR